MSIFELNITVGDSVNKIAAAHQCVTLVRSVSSFASLAVDQPSVDQPSTIVAWQVCQPIESIRVIWHESYNLYATTMPLDINSVITLDAVTDLPAIPGFTYTFKGGPPEGVQGEGSTFKLSNRMNSGNFSFGLAQSATINNQEQLAPLNATPTLFNQTAELMPPTTVAIFLSSCRIPGTIIPRISDNALVIPLSGASSTVKVDFNDSTNSFFLTSLLSKAGEG